MSQKIYNGISQILLYQPICIFIIYVMTKARGYFEQKYMYNSGVLVGAEVPARKLRSMLFLVDYNVVNVWKLNGSIYIYKF